jgi:UMF1 family MFS transporter
MRYILPAEVRDAEPAGSSERASALAVWAWVLYDFSNTIFSISILSVFFSGWLDELEAGPDLFNYITAASALVVAFTAPFLGALADLRQRRRPYLVVLTVLTVALTGALDLAGSVLMGVALFVAADVAYQSAIVFYNALLPGVSVGRGPGKVSGYGTAAGYVGAIIALLLLNVFVTDPEPVRSLLGPLGG